MLCAVLFADVTIGMILVFVLSKIFTKTNTDLLAYIAAGMMSISSAVFTRPTSILSFILTVLVGTVFLGTLFLGLWRSFFKKTNDRRVTQQNVGPSNTPLKGSRQLREEVILCPQCGFTQPASNNYCRKCGLKLIST